MPQHSSPVGIRRAYLRKARLHHPDLNPREIEASSQMSVINEAYATLSDPDLRADYDAHRNTVILKVAPESLGQATVVQGGRERRRGREPGVFGTAVLCAPSHHQLSGGCLPPPVAPGYASRDASAPPALTFRPPAGSLGQLIAQKAV